MGDVIGSGAAAAAGEEVSGLSQSWREIHGQKNWVGLLEPHLDETLREEIIRYGEFAQATYDAFDDDSYSKYCGSCRYNKKKLLEKVGLPDRGYEVTRYIYATEDIDVPLKMLKHPVQPEENVWSTLSNWIGYVAVCTDEKQLRRLGRRDILVAWRGTVTDLEWVSDFEDLLSAPVKKGPARKAISLTDDIKVNAGFWCFYTCSKPESLFNKTSAREQVNKEVLRLIELYKSETLSITITGHSLGAALAVLNAYDIAQDLCSSKEQLLSGLKNRNGAPGIPITIFSFAGPRVGNEAFRKRFEEELGIKALRMVNVNDLVPHIPGVFVNETIPELSDMLESLPWTYFHVGQELKLNDNDSHYLDPKKATIGHRHNLEQYLHLVDGYGRYSERSHRDVTLVNKGSDFLKSCHFIPAHWRQVEDKGLVRNPDGTWTQAARELDDIPVPPPPPPRETPVSSASSLNPKP